MSGMQTHKSIANQVRPDMRGAQWQVHQRGAAIILALLLTTLAVTIVTSLFWPQQVQLRAVENQFQHLQANTVLRRTLDDTRQILRLDAMENGNVTSLDGLWAKHIPAIRLEELTGQGIKSELTLTVRIVDAQSRYNLTNLATDRQINDRHVNNYRRLLHILGIDPDLAERTAIAIARSQSPLPVTDRISSEVSIWPDKQLLAFIHIDDLMTVPGYTPQILAAIREFVVFLPEPTPLNVNTAPIVLLSAITGISQQKAATLAMSRQRQVLSDRTDISLRLDEELATKVFVLDVKSDYFLVEQQIVLGHMAFSSQALVRRKNGGRIPDTQGQDEVLPTSILWMRKG
ncbi:MAG: type II secretion system minor pseudopilin GspK [Pseudomonadota bacterium]